MLSPLWREEARKSRRPGHVSCQTDFQQEWPSTSSSLPRSELQHDRRRQPYRRRIMGGGNSDAVPAVGPDKGGRIRFEFNAAPRNDQAYSGEKRGGSHHQKICTDGRILRGNTNSREKKRKRMMSKRESMKTRDKNDGKVHLSADVGMPVVSATSEIPSSDIERDEAGCLPTLASSWRDKLLLQALRETGEEMKRRRQTDREVRARHAAEEEEVAASLGGARDIDVNRRISGGFAGGTTVAIVTSQAGGEGRWKPALSRRTRKYLSKKRGKRATERKETERQKGGGTKIGTIASAMSEEQRDRRKEGATNTRNRRTEFPTPRRSRRSTNVANGVSPGAQDDTYTASTGNDGVAGSEAVIGDDGGGLGYGTGANRRGGAGARDKPPTSRHGAHLVPFDETPDPRVECGDETTLARGTRETVGAGDQRRSNSMSGPRKHVVGKMQGSTSGGGDGGRGGGGGKGSVSLTTTVEIAVVNGIRKDGDGGTKNIYRSGGGIAVAGVGVDEVAHSKVSGRGRRNTDWTPRSVGRYQLQRESMVGLTCSPDMGNASVNIDNGSSAYCTDHRASHTASPAESGEREVDQLEICSDGDLVENGGGSRRNAGNCHSRSIASELKCNSSGASIAGDRMIEEERAGTAGSGSDDPWDGEKEYPAPSPFRGTFWDEDDARRLSHKVRSGHSRGEIKDTVGGGGDEVGKDWEPPTRESIGVSGQMAFGRDGKTTRAASDIKEISSQDTSFIVETRKRENLGRVPAMKAKGEGDTKSHKPAEGGRNLGGATRERGNSSLSGDSPGVPKGDGVSKPELSDGGLGRQALSAHTRNEDNRRHFFQLYRRMARQMEIVEDTDVLSEEGRTPRQEFIREMLAMGRMPVPILLRNPSALQDLHLAHRGLGDDVMIAAAEVLTRLPHISTLNVADNRLTDRSLCKLCSLVVEMPGLKSLDLSSNKVDEAAAIIRAYLAHPSCSLQTLCLRSADVDDNECCLMMEALSRNQSLTRLDISENKIGQNEMLNAVQPDLVTGGERVAETLEGNITLKELNLSWNNLRQESAAAIGRALKVNRGLVSLNLAHNAFNNLPSQEVGDSLRMNDTLQFLDLSYTGLTPSATIVIASACKANTSLTRLNLSGNRLGRQGSSALLGAIRRRSGGGQNCEVKPLLLELEGCDSESYSPNLFDVDEPSGEYKLDMSLPYSRMVAFELLSLSDWKKGYEIENIWSAKDMESLDVPEKRDLIKTHREAKSSDSRFKRALPCTEAIIKIAQKVKGASQNQTRSGEEVPGPRATGGDTIVATAVLDGYQQSMAKEQVIKLLEAVNLKPSRATMGRALEEIDWSSIETNLDVFFATFRAAFRVFDKDRSGCLEAKELLELFQGLGCKVDEERCKALISVHDLDGSGALEMEEFVSWMVVGHVREPARPKGKLLETVKGKPWMVPQEGAYVISFQASRFPADMTRVESTDGMTAMVQNIRHMNTATERLRIFENAAMHTDMQLTAKQAEMMASLVERDQDRVATAERLLAQVVTFDERLQFLTSFLNKSQRLRLAVRMKGLYRVLMGNPTGFYTLDLGSAQGRTTAIKLGEMANAQKCQATSRGVRDTSQKGNRMIFRNEEMGTVPLEMTVDWFAKLPRSGIIRMDVVSMEVPSVSARHLSDSRFESLKALVGVDYEMKEITKAYERWELQRCKNNKANLRIWQRGRGGGAMRAQRMASQRKSFTSQSEEGTGTAGASTLKGTFNVSSSSNISTATVSRSSSSLGTGASLFRADTSGGEGRRLPSIRDFTETGMSTIYSYHYDACSVFRTKEQHITESVPVMEVPDCIITTHAIGHWQQFYASSHFFLDYVEVEKQCQGTKLVGAVSADGRGSVIAASIRRESTTGAEGLGIGAAGAGRLSTRMGSSQALALKSAIGGNSYKGGIGGAGDKASITPTPTRIYKWVFHRLAVLQTAANAAWYTCQQALEIASAFPWQDFARVQALIIMFSRIVDVKNFSEVVLSAVMVEEKRELEHRLGLLNIHNPERPDGPWMLDLKNWEEREWAKILIKLAVEEPGDNWENESYTHARGMPVIQGWFLSENWTKEDDDMNGDGGPRRSGILCVWYTTDAAKGCSAKWEVRKALRSRTLGGIPPVL